MRQNDLGFALEARHEAIPVINSYRNTKAIGAHELNGEAINAMLAGMNVPRDGRRGTSPASYALKSISKGMGSSLMSVGTVSSAAEGMSKNGNGYGENRARRLLVRIGLAGDW